MNQDQQLNSIKRLKAIAETGLIYSQNDYDSERYQELLDISKTLMAQIADRPITALDNFFVPKEDYPTVKVDVRGLVLNEKDELLMAQEGEDNKWAIPGGWADIGDTPKEAIIKEIREETGLHTKVERLLAVYDKRCHPHPPQPFYIYKMCFLCKVVGGELRSGFDINGTQWASLNELPELSEDRILESQLKQLYKLAKQPQANTYFD